MATEPIPKSGTGKFVRQGHTASEYGTDPSVSAMGKAGNKPRDLKP